MNHNIRTGIVAAAVLSAGSIASANFTANYLGYGNFETHGVGYSTALSWDSSASVTLFNLKLAEHRWNLGGTTVYTWCAQLYQGVTSGFAYNFETVELEMAPQTPPAPGPMGAAKGALLRDAMARFLDSDGRVSATVGSSPASSAAFCALAWEIIHENLGTQDVDVARSRLSLTTGAFRSALSGEAAVIYGNMVASLGQGGYLWADAEGWNSPTAQDQFRLVPSPGSLALLGLAGFVIRRRR
ncbi:MAG: hypothetical protein ACO31E_09550 [Phycisphaerales bacterium]